ncbi:MAG: hypothetical protein PVG49_11180 [Desulfobacteraceae bacterium]|jgi:hypothetical protein
MIVKWEVFSGLKREIRDKRLEEIRKLTKRIEKFAPPRYRKDRFSRYYNYQMMEAYVGPLLELLRVLSEPKQLREDEQGATRLVFLRLKNFYDVRDRLSLEEALEDERLLRKTTQLLVFFYGRPDLRGEVLSEHLNGLIEPNE